MVNGNQLLLSTAGRLGLPCVCRKQAANSPVGLSLEQPTDMPLSRLTDLNGHISVGQKAPVVWYGSGVHVGPCWPGLGWPISGGASVGALGELVLTESIGRVSAVSCSKSRVI